MEWIIVIFIVVVIFIAIICLSASSDKNDNNTANINKLSEKDTLDKWLVDNNCHPSVDFSYNDIYGKRNIRFMVDEQTKTIMISSMNYIPIVIPFSKIISCEIRENNIVTDGIGRAVAGGIIAGGAGAIVGATTVKKYIDLYDVIIFINDIKDPQQTIRLINYKETTDSINYKKAVDFANRVSATIKVIMASLVSTK